jgi:tetratricopeptide (TPR) repeat protein
VPVETDRAALERASQLSPADDRLWLGRANLALRTGAADEAERWLDKCQKLRPDDAALWHTRLRLGLLTKRSGSVSIAQDHLRAESLTVAEAHRVRAWQAADWSDFGSERKELEIVLAADPADERTLTRLAELAKEAHEPEKAAELTRRKAEVARLRERYVQLHGRNQPIRYAEELSRLAGALGRTFESRGFLTIAVSEEPRRADLRQRLRQLNSGSAG